MSELRPWSAETMTLLGRPDGQLEMGLNVAGIDIDHKKLELATRLGAAVTVNAKTTRT